MKFSILDLANATVALSDFSERDLDALTEADLIAAKNLAMLVLRLAEIPAAVIGAAIDRRSQGGAGGNFARRHGGRNAADLLAQGGGGSPGQTHNLITAGQILGGADASGSGEGAQGTAREKPEAKPREKAQPRFPHLAEAYRAGALSSQAASLIRRTLEQMDGVDHASERRLVERAIAVNFNDLRKICQRVVAMWDVGKWEAREKRMRAERYLTVTESVDGSITLHGKLDPASAAPIKVWLDAQVKAGFQARKAQGLGRAEPGEAGRMRLDALVTLCRHGMRCESRGSGTSTTVVVRLDLAALRDAVGMGECDALGTPISAATLRRMAVDAQVIPVTLGKASQPLDVGYGDRYFTDAQRIALAERDGGCAFCHAPVAWCDAHHIDWWRRDAGPTNLSNGVLLCVSCHHRIHDDDWRVEATPERVWFIPPPDVDPGQRPRAGGRAALEVQLGASAKAA